MPNAEVPHWGKAAPDEKHWLHGFTVENYQRFAYLYIYILYIFLTFVPTHPQSTSQSYYQFCTVSDFGTVSWKIVRVFEIGWTLSCSSTNTHKHKHAYAHNRLDTTHDSGARTDANITTHMHTQKPYNICLIFCQTAHSITEAWDRGDVEATPGLGPFGLAREMNEPRHPPNRLSVIL